MNKSLICAAVAAALAPAAWATNGMNMEGYGPVATAMGGASFAYDNGNGGMINNPATLGFMADGSSRLDVAVGGLHPTVASQGVDSAATSFFMPALGYARKDNGVAYGVGVVAQGGMGTKYSNSAMYGGLRDMSVTGVVADPGLENKSEVGVGRVVFPLAVNLTDKFTLGGSVDFVWAGMDIKWLMDGAHFSDMMSTTLNPGARNIFGSLGNTMMTAFGGAMTANACGNPAQGCFNNLNWGYFNFDTGSPVTQKATATGWAGNLGFTYKVSPRLTIGGIYHAKTRLSNMETGDNGATAAFNVNVTASGAAALGVPEGAQTISLGGKVIIKNFQWPETYGLGMAFKADDQWTIVADYKRINWADVMRNFSMTFIASANQATPAVSGFFGGTVLDMTYNQNWKNQNVFMLGAAYKYSDPLTLRFGVNVSNNPVPDAYVSPLFPAIVTNHINAGFGYAMDKQSAVNFSMTYAPKVTVTNNWSAAGGNNQTISHSQANWQLMYSKFF